MPAKFGVALLELNAVDDGKEKAGGFCRLFVVVFVTNKFVDGGLLLEFHIFSFCTVLPNMFVVLFVNALLLKVLSCCMPFPPVSVFPGRPLIPPKVDVAFTLFPPVVLVVEKVLPDNAFPVNIFVGNPLPVKALPVKLLPPNILFALSPPDSALLAESPLTPPKVPMGLLVPRAPPALKLKLFVFFGVSPLVPNGLLNTDCLSELVSRDGVASALILLLLPNEN